MTQSALAAAKRAAPEIDFEGWTSFDGPAAIEGAADGDRAVPPLLALVKKASEGGAEIIIIACFDDTGLIEARALASCPVIGIGQASFIMAAMVSGAAAVITTVEAAIPVIEANLAQSGFDKSIQHVSAAQVPVLMLEDNPGQAASVFAEAARALPRHIDTLILGCAGAVTIAETIEAQVSCRVIDGVTAAARLCRAFG
ncbi:Asp/Glu/Hydantoin racemase [Roseivivax sp. THAF40]|uniref:aspartate/glutamate racemase family protein n=1 Tax=unclassified Roseivivax TaxID=2639302 RepID=UPI0012A94F8B|nr:MULTISPECIES: aspartate/glutamate racemase family protein [unclassified Roseivivax]QFS82583.1 Asp/Glu/Hydantoin racemase [Roseivivax sp. THAF197b]QFT46352.1 Asp/Glu/Hydantoin racemase [Roseivivax sp. THAF40]